MAMSMNAPSYQALVPRLVQREDLTNAIALNSAQFNMSRILGPTLGGYAMALLGVAGNFFLNGVSFLAVLWALTRIRYPEQEQRHAPELLASLRGGFGYLRSERQMLVLVWMVGGGQPAGHSVSHLHSLLCAMQLHAGESGLGWLLAGSGSGAVLGAMTVAALGVSAHRGQGAVIAG